MFLLQIKYTVYEPHYNVGVNAFVPLNSLGISVKFTSQVKKGIFSYDVKKGIDCISKKKINFLCMRDL